MKKIVFFIMLLAGSTMAFGQAGTQGASTYDFYCYATIDVHEYCAGPGKIYGSVKDNLNRFKVLVDEYWDNQSGTSTYWNRAMGWAAKGGGGRVWSWTIIEGTVAPHSECYGDVWGVPFTGNSASVSYPVRPTDFGYPVDPPVFD